MAATFDTHTPAGEALSVAEALFNDLSRQKPEVVTLEDLEASRAGTDKIGQAAGFVAINSDLNLPLSPIDGIPTGAGLHRITGLKAEIGVPTGISPLGTEILSEFYGVVSFREAQGEILHGLVERRYKEKNVPFYWEGMTSLAAAFIYEEETNEFVLLDTFGDNDPTNEIPVLIKPHEKNAMAFNYGFGVPIDLIASMREYQTRAGLNFKKIIRGIAVQESLEANEWSRPLAISRLSKGDYDAYTMLPKDNFVSHVYRAALAFDSIKESHGKLSSSTQESLENLVINTFCADTVLDLLRANTKKKGQGYAGRIGMVDLDPSMSEFYEKVADALELDLNDPDDRKILRGSIYFAPSGAVPMPWRVSNLGQSETATEVTGIFPIPNSTRARNDFSGFIHRAEIIKEISGQRIKGTPKTPGMLKVLSMPVGVLPERGAKGGRMKASEKTILIVDLMKAPGYGMEWFLFGHDPWSYNYDTAKRLGDEPITLRRIFSGDFVGTSKKVGGLAGIFSRADHALLGFSGDTTDPSGASRGYRFGPVLERLSSLAITVSPHGRSSTQIYLGKTKVQLEKKDGTTKPLSDRRTQLGRALPEKFAIEPTVEIPDDEIETVNVVVGPDFSLHVSKLTETDIEHVKGTDKEIPLATVRVMSDGKVDLNDKK